MAQLVTTNIYPQAHCLLRTEICHFWENLTSPFLARLYSYYRSQHNNYQVPPSYARGHSTWLRQYQLFSTPAISLSKTPLLTSAFEIAHEQCGWPLVVWYTILVFCSIFSSCYMQCFGCEWVIILGFPPVVYLSSIIGACICAVPTANAVITGDLSIALILQFNSVALRRRTARGM